MKKHIGFGSELSLLELVIVIGLFAVFAALDLRIFAQARRLETESSTMSHAAIAAQNAAECFKAGERPVLYYDGDWLPSDNENAEYIVILDIFVESGIESASISVTDKSGELFALTAKKPAETLS